MKTKILFITSLLLIVGCSKEPINFETTLIEKEGVYYTKDTNQPYSGPVFSIYDINQKKEEGSLKEGKRDGLFTGWYQNGQKKFEETWKNGKKYGESFEYYQNGEVLVYNDGVLIWNVFNQNPKKEVHEYYTGSKEVFKVLEIDDGKEKLVGFKGFYNNGQKWFESSVLEEGGDGLTIEWYENGQRKDIESRKDSESFSIEWCENGNKDYINITYSEGNRDFTDYWCNGNKYLEGFWIDGKQDSLWTWWYENGQKGFVLKFDYSGPFGQEMKPVECFDNKGVEEDCDYEFMRSVVF